MLNVTLSRNEMPRRKPMLIVARIDTGPEVTDDKMITIQQDMVRWMQCWQEAHADGGQDGHGACMKREKESTQRWNQH
jgi:hypothetical protein